jgi:hypothetical protein
LELSGDALRVMLVHLAAKGAHKKFPNHDAKVTHEP